MKEEIKNKIRAYLAEQKEKWTLGLTYICDKDFENQFEVCEGHLDIILKDIDEFIKNL